MDDSRKTPQTDSARRLQAARRAARGVVAGYIHELSARHGRRNDSRGDAGGSRSGPTTTNPATGQA